ncbi:hypothetical protein HOY82DRAFT_607853 [Tuber indicum]|nr:hypothetical protein HOY82DRAFT_607853 [Tuber indicum]
MAHSVAPQVSTMKGIFKNRVALVVLQGVKVIEVKLVEFAFVMESNQGLDISGLGLCMPRLVKMTLDVSTAKSLLSLIPVTPLAVLQFPSHLPVKRSRTY